MADAPNPHGYYMKSGRHRGERITRVPVSYLKWMVNDRHSESEMAAAELARRGTSTPELDVSGHAIDSASLRCRDVWRQTKKGAQEGIYAWLTRIASEALEQAEPNDMGRVSYAGMILVFEMDGCWPVLKTVMRDKKAEKNG